VSGDDNGLPAGASPTSEAWHYASGYKAIEKSVALADELTEIGGKRGRGPEGDGEYTAKLKRKKTTSDKKGEAKESSDVTLAARLDDRGLEQVKQFMAERAAVEGLTFQAATGYWANGYVPGDPVLRLLQARLARGDRSQLTARSGDLPELDGAARPYLQSFDPPATAALGLTVRADRRSADGPARMLLQVGLKGTARQSGRRPAMNIGVVLDVREASSSEARASLRGLLSALLASKQVGDRFSLTVAGRPGGLVLTADDFKNGPLTVAMRQLFGDETELGGAALSLPEALERASIEVRGTDDPTAPLGSSLTLLITATPLDATEFPQLVSLAHANAVDGIGLSAVGVGESVDLDQLTQLAAAGQGNRRLLLEASDASRVIERELSAVGAVVARALRVRIRLAPGVKLVDVIGSRRLDVAGAERARRAETSIDRRVARARGITADRGNDEDGIQIIIPSFYAGDSHVILLDIVADGPGAVADVTVRYKDLVFLRNGVARDSLELRRGEVRAGKLERGVFKNYVAHRVAMDLRSAGKALAAGGLEAAAQQLGSLDELLTGLPSEVPALAKDTEFSRDAAMVAEYLALLTGGNLRDDGRPYVADSLVYAGWRKLVPVRDESD
jgi:Ca-activated chloride channel family protein